MKINQQLKIKQNQSIVMTPQLQQAIKLLQLTNIELAEYVENAKLENPFIKEDLNIKKMETIEQKTSGKRNGDRDTAGVRNRKPSGKPHRNNGELSPKHRNCHEKNGLAPLRCARTAVSQRGGSSRSSVSTCIA